MAVSRCFLTEVVAPDAQLSHLRSHLLMADLEYTLTCWDCVHAHARQIFLHYQQKHHVRKHKGD